VTPRVRLSIRGRFLDGRDFGNLCGDLRRAFGTAAFAEQEAARELGFVDSHGVADPRVNLNELAAALPRAAERLDMRYQWISRLLGKVTGVSSALSAFP
jgi:hypothetical protein